MGPVPGLFTGEPQPPHLCAGALQQPHQGAAQMAAGPGDKIGFFHTARLLAAVSLRSSLYLYCKGKAGKAQPTDRAPG